MCIIAIKDKGVNLPDEKIIKTMFYNNPDGAGFMYAENGKVIIKKGFMTYENLEEELNKIHNIMTIPLILHFRIATSGKIDKGTTHPFPIEKKRSLLRKLHCETDIGIVHNGIIPIKPSKSMSDTMQYISNKLYMYKHLCPDFYKHKYLLKRIEKEIQSKMVFLNANGEIYKIGEFTTDNGITYSNTSYKYQKYLHVPEMLYPSELLLCPIDGYIVDCSGELFDINDELFLMDYYGQVYKYNYEFDMAIPIYAEAYTYSGTPYIFDENNAMILDAEY